MKKKFKIMYPEDYWDTSLAGKPYKPPQGDMVVMGVGGVFYLARGVKDYSTDIVKLSSVLYKYDVIWKDFN